MTKCWQRQVTDISSRWRKNR